MVDSRADILIWNKDNVKFLQISHATLGVASSYRMAMAIFSTALVISAVKNGTLKTNRLLINNSVPVHNIIWTC